jgi:hypothetical protein
MSLPARQQRLLDRIERTLRATEPHMASKFAIFTRLTKDEGPARTEQLRGFRLPVLRRLRVFGWIPMVFALLFGGALVGGTAHGVTRCGAGRMTAVSLNADKGSPRSALTGFAALRACGIHAGPVLQMR